MPLNVNLTSKYALESDTSDSEGNYNATNNGVTFANDASLGRDVAVFNGGYISIPAGLETGITTSYTLSMWVKPTTLPQSANSYCLFSDHVTGTTYPGMQAHLKDSGLIEIGHHGANSGSSTYGTSTTAIAAGVWTHLAFAFDGNALKIYINGVLGGNVAMTHVPWNNPTPLQVGRNSTFTHIDFIGSMSDIRFWTDRALSAVDLESLQPPLTLVDGLILQHNMDDATADVGSIGFSNTANGTIAFATGDGRSYVDMDDNLYGNLQLDSALDLGAGGWTLSTWFSGLRHAQNHNSLGRLWDDWNGSMANGSWQTFLSTNAAGEIHNDSGNNAQSTGYNLVSNVTDSDWHMITAVHDGSSAIDYYLDGVLVGSTSNWGGHSTLTSINSGQNNAWFLSNVDGNGYKRAFADKIDDFRAWNRALSSSEIATLHTETTVVLNTSPQLSINPSSLSVGEDPSGTYTDTGISATDAEDGDLTGSVVVGGDIVDLSVPGDYTLTYSVTDSQGATATGQRTVTVTPANTGVDPTGGFSGLGLGESFTSLIGRGVVFPPGAGFYGWPDQGTLATIMVMLNNGQVWQMMNDGFPVNLTQDWNLSSIPNYSANSNQFIEAPGSLNQGGNYWFTKKPSGSGSSAGEQIGWAVGQVSSAISTWGTSPADAGQAVGAFYSINNGNAFHTVYNDVSERNFVWMHDGQTNSGAPVFAMSNLAASTAHKSILDGHQVRFGEAEDHSTGNGKTTHVIVAKWREDAAEWQAQRIFHHTHDTNDFTGAWNLQQSTGWTGASGIKRPRYSETLDRWFAPFGGWGEGGVLVSTDGFATSFVKTDLYSAHQSAQVDIKDVGFANVVGSTILAVGDSNGAGVVFASKDGGSTWEERVSSSSKITSVLNVSEGVWLLGCEGGSIAVSLDDGYNFIPVNTFKDDPSYISMNGDVVSMAKY